MKKVLILGVMLLCITSYAQKTQQPNIVFIIADDVSCDDLSCYGNKGIKTPNIQQLAQNGIRFTNAYLTAANCSPSRSSIATGRWPVSNGQTDLATGALPNYNLPFPKFFDNIDFFPELLQKAGYYTAQSGKWHIGYYSHKASGPVAKGFSHTDSKGGASGAKNWLNVLENRPKDKPFFMWFASHDAHRPWTAPKVHNPEDVELPPYIPDTEFMRKEIATYYDEIHRLDKHIGAVVAKLKEQGVYENTIIVFMADNGRPFWRSKAYIYDGGMKTPLIVNWPQKSNNKQIANQLVSAIDLAPTFCAIAGINPDDYTFQGRSILPIIENTNHKEVNRYVISEQNWHGFANHYRSVRDTEGYVYVWNGHPERSAIGQIRYVSYMKELNEQGKLTNLQKDPFRYPRESEELYNFKKDIHQSKNLIFDDKYKNKMRELRKVLKRWKKLTGDKIATNEVPDWYQRPYSTSKPQKGKWGDAPGTFNYGVGSENKVKKLTRYD